MKKKIIITVLILIFLATVSVFSVDMYLMKNNKPVLFSTWGYLYAPPVSVSDANSGFTKEFKYNNLCAQVSGVYASKSQNASDGFESWEYEKYMVYPGAEITVKSADMWTDDNGKRHSNWAFYKKDDTRIPITDDLASIEITEDLSAIYDTESSVFVLEFEIYKPEDTQSFVGEVLDETTKYMIVRPGEDEYEREIADEIKIDFGTDHIDYLYGLGRKVVIYYHGGIEKGDIATIKSDDISTEGFGDWELVVIESYKPTKEKIISKSQPHDSDLGWYKQYNLYYYGAEDVKIRVDGNYMPLEDAIKQGKISMSAIISKANQDTRDGIIPELIYKDGGSQVYKYPYYTIVKYHTIDGNDDMYIGTSDIDIDVKNK